MTKLKSKKMTKSTFAVIIMAIAMVAMLAFGGTYAYFTDIQAVGEAGFSTGKIDLTAGEIGAFSVTKLMPGDTATATGSVTLSADSEDAYIGIVYTESTGTAGDDLSITVTGGTGKAWTKVVLNEGEENETIVYVYTGSGSTPVAAAKAANDFTVTATLDWNAGNAYQALSNLTVTLAAKAIQVKNFVEANVTGGPTLQNVATYLVGALEYTPAT